MANEGRQALKQQANPLPARRKARARSDGRPDAHAPCAPLSAHKAGDAVRIVEVGGSQALKRRLRDMGLRPGKAIEVCQESPAGMVVSAQGLKLALAHDAADAVLVQPAASRATRG